MFGFFLLLVEQHKLSHRAPSAQNPTLPVDRIGLLPPEEAACILSKSSFKVSLHPPILRLSPRD